MFEGVPNERHEKVVISQIIMEDGHQPPPPPLEYKSGLGQKLLRVVYKKSSNWEVFTPTLSQKTSVLTRFLENTNALMRQKDYFLIYLSESCTALLLYLQM